MVYFRKQYRHSGIYSSSICITVTGVVFYFVGFLIFTFVVQKYNSQSTFKIGAHIKISIDISSAKCISIGNEQSITGGISNPISYSSLKNICTKEKKVFINK